MHLPLSKVTCIINILRKLTSETLLSHIARNYLKYAICHCVLEPCVGLLSKIIFHLYIIRPPVIFVIVTVCLLSWACFADFCW